ncbi:MAG: hypothetical protein HPY55_01925 [Firmicutes bacterium]|nr:hypothetical protein [Bacillota bacterium]
MKAQSIKVAAIGPSALVDEMLAVARCLRGLQVLPFAYQTASEAPRLCAAASKQAEVILFTGPVGYRQAMREHRPGVPTTFIPYSPMWLYSSLFKVRDRGALHRVSVDTINRDVVEATYQELGLDLETIKVLQYEGLADPEQVTEFHLKLFREGVTTHALTCLLAVYGRLQGAGVSCSWLVPSRAAMEQALEKAMYLAEGARARGAQIVVGLVRARSDWKGMTQFEQQRLRLRAYEILLSHAEEVDGHVVDCGGGEYQFFTTRAEFEKTTSYYTCWPVLEKMAGAGLDMGAGVGFGITANEAGINARAALEEAVRQRGSSCYVILENKRLIGPLGSCPMSYDLRSTDPTLVQLARESHMAAVSLNRVAAALSQLGDEFTAHDLASRLRVGLRTSHRVLSKLLASGYIVEAGQENAGSRGRPKRVFRVAVKLQSRGG